MKETAEAAATAAGTAVSTAEDAAADVETVFTTVEGHTTSLANIEGAQTEAAIVQTGITSEQGSLLYNAGFSETLTSTNFAMAKGFYPFLHTPALLRVTNETATGMASFGSSTGQSYGSQVYSSSSSLYLDVGQTGSALAVLTTDKQEPYTY